MIPSHPTSPRDVQAVDVHGHYGAFTRPELPELNRQFSTADAAAVVDRARRCRIAYTVVSPLTALLPRGQADSVVGNKEASEVVPATPGLLQWVVINPRQPQTYAQAAAMLATPTCVGIKIHPEEHLYPIREYGDAIFKFAAEHSAVVLAHTGEANSMPADFLPFADEYPEMKIILAHIGHGPEGRRDLQVRAVCDARHRNVYADTSSAISITPGLIEFAVREAGADRVLFGTDTPLYHTAMQRERINAAEMEDACKRQVLRDNALSLLNISDFSAVSDPSLTSAHR